VAFVVQYGAPPSVGVGQGAPTTTTTAPGTAVIAYEPFTAQGTIDPNLHVTATLTATTCFSAGVAGNSSFRCFAQRAGSSDVIIYDPCFARPGEDTGPLLCTTDPATDDVVQLTTTGSLPGPTTGAPQERPWAIELANGQVCIQVNAAWGGLGPFGCQTSAPRGSAADCHVPEQSTSWWTVACQKQQSSPFVTYRVDTAWT
jgi:hypothetical protein